MENPIPAEIKVILADEDAVLCVMARRALEKVGYQVTIAYDGADLLARFDPAIFDVVVVGVTVQRVDGLQVLRGIKKINPTTQVILLADEKTIDAAKTGVSEGAFAYIVTPIEDFAQVGYAIERAYEMAQLRQEVATMDEVKPAPTSNNLSVPPTRLLRELIEATRTKPLAETMQILAEASAQLLEAPHTIVMLFQPTAGLQPYTAFGFGTIGAAQRDLTERIGDDFVWRTIKERKTLLAPIGEDGEKAAQVIGTPLLASDQVIGAIIGYPLPTQPINASRIVWLESLAAQGVLATELSRLQTENEHLSRFDPMTGVLKREIFLDQADREFRRSWRYNQPITAIIVDVDGMTSINLTGGHEFGDQVMRAIANVCHNAVRSIDLVGRYEGDSFVMLLLMTGREGAKSVAERLRIGINSIQLANPRGAVSITASLGVCSYPRDGCASIFDLLSITEEAQRMARRNGPNQIVYA